MSTLNPQTVATWLRERAKKYNETAALLEEDLGFGHLGVKASETPVAPRTTPLTAKEFEESVENKSGRVNDLAERLGTTPTQILSMLHPASRVIVGSRGWLLLKEPEV